MASKPKTSGKAKPKANLGDWREETLARMRALILEADPKMIEERKWRKPSNAMAGVPVWSHLFNSSLEGNTRRAIDIHQGTQVNARAFKALVKAAVAENSRTATQSKSPSKTGEAALAYRYGGSTTQPGSAGTLPWRWDRFPASRAFWAVPGRGAGRMVLAVTSAARK